jgi:hypothetical protein
MPFIELSRYEAGLQFPVLVEFVLHEELVAGRLDPVTGPSPGSPRKRSNSASCPSTPVERRNAAVEGRVLLARRLDLVGHRGRAFAGQPEEGWREMKERSVCTVSRKLSACSWAAFRR